MNLDMIIAETYDIFANYPEIKNETWGGYFDIVEKYKKGLALSHNQIKLIISTWYSSLGGGLAKESDVFGCDGYRHIIEGQVLLRKSWYAKEFEVQQYLFYVKHEGYIIKYKGSAKWCANIDIGDEITLLGTIQHKHNLDIASITRPALIDHKETSLIRECRVWVS